MRRRELLKTLSLSIGGIVATPTLMQILTSCENSKEALWTPEFLDVSEGYILENLVDLILPISKSIGALDVKVPMFIDLVLKDVIPLDERKLIMKGGVIFKEKFEELFENKIEDGKKNEFSTLLSTYFKIPGNKQKEVFKMIEMKEDEVPNKELYYLYKYLTFIRRYTLFGFYNSKKVGTEILNYDPIPGSYQPCVPLSEIKYSSSI